MYSHWMGTSGQGLGLAAAADDETSLIEPPTGTFQQHSSQCAQITVCLAEYTLSLCLFKATPTLEEKDAWLQIKPLADTKVQISSVLIPDLAQLV